MKKIVIALLLVTYIVNAQNSQQKVWDLLLSNKREEARKAFDKDFKTRKDDNVDLLILDAIIDRELGRVSYDKEFLQQFSKFPESKDLLYSLWYNPFIIGVVGTAGYDDLSYEKMDFIASVDNFKNDPHVLYNKAVFDRKRRNNKGFLENINKLGAIDRWQFCGVFENLNGSGLETEYEAEMYAKNDRKFNANSNGFVNWYNPLIPQLEGCHYYVNESEYGNGIIYAQTFITVDFDKEVVLNFGTGGPLKLFLNDVEIYADDKVKNTDVNGYHLKLNLKKGTNRLVVKSSIDGGNDYIYADIKDVNQQPVANIQYANNYVPYNKSTLAEINPVEVASASEAYLQQKLKADPNNALYSLLLFDTYAANFKTERAYEVIEHLCKKYPNSSLLAIKLINYYTQIDDSAKVDEITKNLIINDEGYYYSLIKKLDDANWLQETNISELERYKEKAKKLKSSQFGILYEFIIAIRNADIDLSIAKLDELTAASYNNEHYTTSFADMYTSLKNDKQKTISVLEGLVSKRENLTAQNKLIGYYNAQGRKDDVKKLVISRMGRYPYFNNTYEDALIIANNDNNYDEVLRYADAGLKNFPYSFKLMEQKGRGYNSLKNTKEAEKYFKESLVYNSGNTTLRKTLYDIAKVPNEIDQVAIKDVYNVIKQRRNSNMPNDYGVNMLIDEYIVNILPEGGRRSKVLYAYEIVAQNGIEQLKEYSLQGNNINIIKAEIVKPDGSIVPGEENDGTVVFSNLAVRDVIYIEYEVTNNSTGRFYKDFNLIYNFNGIYPAQHSVFGVLYPTDVKFSTFVANGDIPSKTKKVNNMNYMYWEKNNQPALPLEEDYAPNYDDLTNTVYVGSIKSWSDISNWYADLVKRNMKMDNVAVKAFNDIFPKGTSALSQEEIAFSIYKYIEENITYSSLDFRQSGYVPQKPSKTITSKLGDCKDVSTLFVAMAQRAGLTANLVLVQTADNGIDNLKLPAVSFNHCIVRVIIDGKVHFVEMTNNYLPFKAMPMRLYKANALVISFDKTENEKNGLINIPFTNNIQSVLTTVSTVNVEDGVKKFINVHNVKGANKSYYNELFYNATTADVRNKEFEEALNSRLNKVISLDGVKAITNDRFGESITYETKFSVSEKIQSVGSLKIMEVPFLDKVYTRDIIVNEKRNFDIDYSSYENVNEYRSEVIINIPADKKFTEFPQGHEFSYKGHKYKISYNIVSPNSLKVLREVKTSWENIKAADYPAFKKFIEDVIAAEEEIVGYK